jgi:uncharacterized membrane protein
MTVLAGRVDQIDAASIPLSTGDAAVARRRLQSIDAVRGLVMVLMLLDHVRETWFVYVPVADPVDARTTIPALFFARLAVSLCAPIFVALTGIGVFLYRSNHSLEETTSYLLKRGLLLMAIEVLYLSPLYWGIVQQPTLWLQVIWCIGVCMIVLAAAIRLPRAAIIALGLAIVCGHNLLDPIQLQPGDPWLPLWAEVHQRAAFDLPFGFVAKTTYPVFAWIGVIFLGYGVGPWFLANVDPSVRRRRLIALGAGMLAAFLIIRGINVYGDKPWFVVAGDPARTAMSFFSLTKYPPSLLFLLPTLGVGALLLAIFERAGASRSGLTDALSVFGGAPMFFYIFHLTMLRILYHTAFAIWGPTQGQYFGVGDYGWVLVWYVALIVPLYLPTAWYSRLKKRRRDITWLKYF